MDAQKVQVKVYAKSEIDDDAVIPVFHAWIREKVVSDELMIDVADYAHVPNGPGIALIGHQSDFFVDRFGGRQGLTYSRKRQGPEGFEATVADAFKRALTAVAKLEGDLGTSFGTGEFLFRINDRLTGANTPENVAAAKPAVEAVVAKLFPGASATVEAVGTPRELLSLKVSVDSSDSAETLAGRL